MFLSNYGRSVEEKLQPRPGYADDDDEARGEYETGAGETGEDCADAFGYWVITWYVQVRIITGTSVDIMIAKVLLPPLSVSLPIYPSTPLPIRISNCKENSQRRTKTNINLHFHPNRNIRHPQNLQPPLTHPRPLRLLHPLVPTPKIPHPRPLLPLRHPLVRSHRREMVAPVSQTATFRDRAKSA